MRPLRITSSLFSVGGPDVPFQALVSDQNRVFAIVTLLFPGSTTFIGNDPAGLQATAHSVLFGQSTLDWLRRDYGPLVQGEWWLSDGFGGAPDCGVVITEGALIS